ncbi:Diacetyl reductase [(S)-acetoin forming] [Luteitalea pratensis]|uniref:Diacetyl reductase [(S)-acetoin forming] n=2 Tax=Luteitalea pratensis TaxID=1855912 RepID=A0A143PPW7_LUTPR|nr:SDR family oxidoreductase [Luteitalea pratensis]AMY10652.1 Diacetyl reductase [(S)-acetoin forming] [Luteitalea pratensis]
MAPARIALVTGAGSGIGRAVAVGLMRAGYAVALVGRRASALEETVAEAGPTPGAALVLPADVTQPDAVRDVFARTRVAYGRLDVLFNNAGVTAPAVPLEDVSFDQWQQVVGVNLTGVFLCTQEAFRIMKAQVPRGGRIINNGSIAAHVPRPHAAPYAATKHAVTGLTRATALDGRAFNIACGQIDIGNAATDMARGYAHGVLQPNGTTAVEPLLDLSHVVDAVMFMAGLPVEANVPFITVMATGMPYLGRG